MPTTANITFLRCPMSTAKTRLELKHMRDAPEWPLAAFDKLVTM